MKYYHLSAACMSSNRERLETAFHAEKPDNELSENWNQFDTECVVKAPAGVDLTIPAIAIYDDPPVAMVSNPLWHGNIALSVEKS